MRGSSRDTVRRTLKAIDQTLGSEWLSGHLGRTVLGLLDAPWILDADMTIEPLYGKQQGAVLGYNLHKPDRPSHAYHNYEVCGLRIELGVDVAASNESHADDSLPALVKLRDSLPDQKRHWGCGTGSGADALCVWAEVSVKLRLANKVKDYIEKVFWEQD